ncbi:MAG: histidine kinase N-terminal 7TM domain-containing protein, partial [Chloroflexota bacterium]
MLLLHNSPFKYSYVAGDVDVSIWALIPLISCLTYIALCAVAVQSIEKQTNRHANRVFVYFLAVSATWSFTSFMLHLNANPDVALFWNEALTVALVWTLIAYYHFVLIYTSRRSNLWLYTGYGMLTVLAILSFTGHIVQYSYVVDGVLYHSLGISLYFIGALSAAFVAAVLHLLVKKYRYSNDPVDRNRTMYLLVGWSILVILTYTNLIPPMASLPFDHLGNLANALIISYVISHFQLLNIKFVIRRGLTYLILISAVVTIYMSTIFLGYNLMATQPAISIVSLATIIALLLALTASPLEHIIQEGIDRMFYRETYDYRQTIFSFRKNMGNILDLEELANEILPAITKALHINHAKLLFQDNGVGNFITKFNYPQTLDDENGDLEFKIDNPIINWLEKDNAPLSMEQLNAIPELKGLWQSEKALLAKTEIGLLCPIASH